MKLEDDHMCYGCGKENPNGFHLEFKRGQKGELSSQITFSKEHQGFKDIVHGGMVATALDEMMGNLTWLEGVTAMTVQMTVRYKKAVRVGQRILLRSKIESQKGRLIHASATAVNTEGEAMAEAFADYLTVKPR